VPLVTPKRTAAMSASLIGRLGSSTFRLSAAAVSMSLTGSCFSSESALGPFHHGIRGRSGAILGAALPSDERWSKRTCDLTSSIVPRGTSFHRSVELEFPPIAFDPARLSGRCDFPGPAELGAVNPDAVHDPIFGSFSTGTRPAAGPNHVGCAPESDLIAASPRNDATGQ